jgi:hypothetical protein
LFYYFFFFFLVMLYSNFVMNTLEKIPGAATEYILMFFLFLTELHTRV